MLSSTSVSLYCYAQLGHSPPITSHSAERGRGMYYYSYLATKRNKQQEKSIYMTFDKICTTLVVEHYLQSSYPGTTVFCFRVFQQTGSAGGHLVAI
jgi:hypothetical protein